MRSLIAGGALIAASAVMADAAVYQYDITVELKEATVLQAYGYSNSSPTNIPSGVSCFEGDSYFTCEGDASGVEDLRGTGALSGYPDILSASLFLDTDYSIRDGGREPVCFGSGLLCSRSSIYGYYASPTGFGIYRSLSGQTDENFTSNGFFYEDDASYEFSFGGIGYYTIAGIRLQYVTTSLDISEVSPIPVPASLPLLLAGLGTLGFARRRSNERKQTHTFGTKD
ncbi:VPLPA-CTERM sorting domain-containing protein [Palleronia sp. LCG004]|uniref:VPLPA-CTERM sorting domain-containing protein n=1 Tax=Palleronia sp. LCG004 TaxID=3079304 RepID=UPI002942C2B9|nr:VPLPA-CTERM sorting domain-containing protein [Palleronia sp. LCG004]WOI54939.1 VPLPA-CTERM sorting domain-containing protein [Palleronia sp. LCG004]